MSLKDWIKSRVATMDLAARPWATRSRFNAFAYEFLLFGLKQAWACLYGGAMVALLIASHFWWPADAALARYDFLLIAALTLQVLLLATKLERWDEALVIAVFHVVGTVMEIFKTSHGSWIYPEASVLMPVLLGFLLVAVFIWFAENIGTFTATWTYPQQAAEWRPVGLAKLGSWYLLMMLSFVLVSLVHRPEPVDPNARES
ncbi:DUF817 family protein [Phenylobacterium sp.]|uniref:DUF817 family protein n=1 Tax=Phenylobacterium sp. TaxID=1871053 RepID=UPI002737D1C4|nr:DUF817 family protein [Phenylobacterium sp.]MDP3868442.1 DUF817 family protein [Phenylobacterium sp.]